MSARFDDTQVSTWIAALHRREQQALQQIHAASARRLARFLSLAFAAAGQYVDLRPDIDEAINDTLLELWRDPGKYRFEYRFETWLKLTAKRNMIDLLRKNGRHQTGRQEIEADELETMHIAEGNPPEACLLQAEQWEAVEHCLDRLDKADDRLAFVLWAEAHSTSEIARIVGCPPGTVKSRLFTARNKLRQCIERFFRQA